MSKRYIKYKCNECGCEFAVDREEVKYAERNNIYIGCPLDGRHNSLRLIKELMEEKSAVVL